MESEQEMLNRITVNPGIFSGKPIIRGMRMGVEHILGMLAAGDTVQVILEEYPFLEREDIQACTYTPTALWQANMCMSAYPFKKRHEVPARRLQHHGDDMTTAAMVVSTRNRIRIRHSLASR